MAGDQAYLEAELKKKIVELEAKLKEALSGFDSERQALEKKRTDM